MRYLRIANTDGKVWLMPRHNTRVALELYQPSGWRGRLLKSILPLLAKLPERFSPFPVVDFDIEPAIAETLQRLFPQLQLEWSVFEGTPSVHQKRIIQVFCGDKILAYYKVSDNPGIVKLFTDEAALLEELHLKGVDGIPRCLFLGPLSLGGKQLLVQSTVKSLRSQIVHTWSESHQSFVGQLQEKTQREVPFEECDLAHAIHTLRQRWEQIPVCLEKSALVTAMSQSEERYGGRTLVCGVMHGDFTPWNMFVEGAKLFVFDWEYAHRCCPIGLDRYHFFIQTAFFKQHWSASKVMDHSKSPAGSWMEPKQMQNYLLVVLACFVGREPEGRQMEDTPLLAYWNELIKLCQQKL